MSSYAGFDSVPQALTMRALNHNFTLEERHRREEAQLNKDFYYGKQEHTLILMNDDVEPLIMNITKPIMGKRGSMLYSRPLKREFIGPSQSAKYLEEVYHFNNIDSFMKRVDTLAELTGSVLVHPKLDPEMPGGVRFVMWDATQFSGIGREDDPMIPQAVSLIRMIERLEDHANQPRDVDPEVKRVLQTQVWTPETVVLYDSYDGDKSHLRDVVDNELGFLPFVNVMGEEVPDSFVGHAPAELVRKANHHINQMLTHLGFMIKMQSHTPIVLQGFKHGESVVVHPGRAINIPNDTAASTLSLNPKIADTLGTIEFLEDKLYTCSNVPRISVEGGEGQSGRELMIRWHPLLQVFNEKTVRYNRYETEIANMCLAVAGLDPIEEVKVEWPEEDVLPLSAEEEMLERDVALGIATPVDEIMRRDPELSEEEAWAEYMVNLQINQGTLTINEEPAE